MNSVIKKVPLLLAFFATSVALHAGGKDGCCERTLPNEKRGCTLADHHPSIDPLHNINFHIGPIVQEARISGTEFAHVENDATGLPVKGELVSPKSKMQWGLNLGVCRVFDQDGWKSSLDFTLFQPKSSYTFTNGSGSSTKVIVPDRVYADGILAGSNVDSFTDATSKLKTDFYKLQWLLSRGTYLSGNLSVQPMMGLQTAWIDIKQNSEFTSSALSILSEDSRSKSWGIGPVAGLDTVWHLGCTGFSFFGDFKTALLFGKTDVSQTVKYSSDPATYSAIMSYGQNLTSPALHLTLGGQYEASFFECSQHAVLRLGLDTQHYWNQNRVIRAQNGSAAPIQYDLNSNNTYGMIGLIVDVSWNF